MIARNQPDRLTHSRKRTRALWWLWGPLLLSILLCAGVYALWFWKPSDALSSGQDAYARGDWSTAAKHARERLVKMPGDIPSLQLLARSSVKLGLDASALLFFQQLGPQAMAADDFFLLGHALRRTGNERGLEVWEQSLQKNGKHAETLEAVSQVYFEESRFNDAARLADRLKEHPSWKRRALLLLGKIAYARNDFEEAIASWRLLLDEPSGQVQTDSSTSDRMRKDLARALLHAKRPSEARKELQPILGEGPDQEASWLLSRVCLQEGRMTEALAALRDAGPLAEDDPLYPEPAPFVGAASCAPCHATKFQAQQTSHHAQTFYRASELNDLELPAEPIVDPADSRVSHTFRQSGKRLEQETRTQAALFQAVVDYAFGSGDRGKTLVGHDRSGRILELRLSRYQEKPKGIIWDLTSGHGPYPLRPDDYLGLPLTEDAAYRCFHCHVTNPRAILNEVGPESADHSIGCEKCHGPGGNHLTAVDAKFPELAIARPGSVSGSRIVKLCAECHSPIGKPVEPNDPTSVRSQGTTLTWSRCYTESNDRLDCVTCHDPHRNVETTTSHYEAKCLTCHPGDQATSAQASGHRLRHFDLTPAPRAPSCPVNPAEGCISCHMPVVKDVIPHSPFTDHFIRIHPESAARAAH